MIISRTVTKKVLETIVHETFSTFGILSCSSLLDSLKLLGFYYATNAGISINIEDLKTPNVKKDFIATANEEIDFVSQRWQDGFVSDTERFQSIIDSWNMATEGLKNRIVEYYHSFDPVNNLYIMAFSGARGNMSQVRQLVGMRGLMSDQDGKIIDLPIQRNFREGLSSIDYIISSYGARKGIVDTALKTADSGYLTRRLIYLAQDLIIREMDCHSKKGVLIQLKKNTAFNNLTGRYLVWGKKSFFPYKEISQKNIFLTTEILEGLKAESPLSLNLRSSLICQSNGSVCQTCYGWDLAQNQIISLGEAVGIIAAQSIGEPGTQLTMRTFHTGGIFTGETVKQIRAPFSGKLIIPSSLKILSYRTNHGVLVLKLQQETKLKIIDWKGNEKKISLGIGSFLYVSSSSFLQKGALIAEYSTQSLLLGERRLKPIFSPFSGEIKYENLLVQSIKRENGKPIRANPAEGVLWITSAKVFPLPFEAKFFFPKALKQLNEFASLKIITPKSGLIFIEETKISIVTDLTKITLNLLGLIKPLENCATKFFPLVRNYQYVDLQTILGKVSFFPNYDGQIYSVRKKETESKKRKNSLQVLFLTTEADIWKLNSDQVNEYSFFESRKTLLRRESPLNELSLLTQSGYFLKKDGFKMIFQKALPIFLSPKTVLHHKAGDYVFERNLVATLLNYTQQTEDIVQGLPKIEELIEARKPKGISQLAQKPGVIINSSFSNSKKVVLEIEKEGIIHCIRKSSSIFPSLTFQRLPDSKRQTLMVLHNIPIRDNLIIYDGEPFFVTQIPSIFTKYLQYTKKGKIYYVFKNRLSPTEEMLDEKLFLEKKESESEEIEDYEYNENDFLEEKKQEIEQRFYEILRVKGRKSYSKFKNIKDVISDLYKYENGQLNLWKKIPFADSEILHNSKNDAILMLKNQNPLFLEYANPLIKYKMSSSSKLLVKLGNFVDLGEPLTEGIVDTHELLHILFDYHEKIDGMMEGTFRSLQKFQLILVNSIQAIYQSQGVNIASKHIEIIVKQMTAKVLIRSGGHTPFLPGEFVSLSCISQIVLALKDGRNNEETLNFPYQLPKYEPKLLSATNSSLTKDSFLSSAGFQETRRVLSKAALEGSSDWLRGLKECIMIGRLIPAGSTFLNYKNYLDKIQSFKR